MTSLTRATDPSADRIRSLPRWAQDLIQEKNNRLAELEELLSVARRDAAGSGCTGKITVDAWGVAQQAFPIPDRARVVFAAGGGRIEVFLRGQVLEANALDGTLSILPRAANCAYLQRTR